jgi:hypothetical protein
MDDFIHGREPASRLLAEMKKHPQSNNVALVMKSRPQAEQEKWAVAVRAAAAAMFRHAGIGNSL